MPSAGGRGLPLADEHVGEVYGPAGGTGARRSSSIVLERSAERFATRTPSGRAECREPWERTQGAAYTGRVLATPMVSIVMPFDTRSIRIVVSAEGVA